MDIISGLTDDLLLKVLSFLPTKVAVSTSILSKRWECLWMWLTKLDYKSRYCSQSQCQSLRCFLDRNLPLHRAPVIESFRLDFAYAHLRPEDIKLWLVIAVSRYLRELEISNFSYSLHGNLTPNILPNSLYICKSLVTLKLDGDIVVDVPRMVCLPSLKTLELRQMKHLDGESLRRLLSICPNLEDLWVDFRDSSTFMGMITIIVPSLQSLSLRIPNEGYLYGLVISTPSLKYLKLEDYSEKNHSRLIENMPKLEDAYVDVRFLDMKNLIRSITSVKRLTLCLGAVYGDGFVFNQLEHLKVCVCKSHPSNLLVRLLEDSLNLRVLDIFQIDDHDDYSSLVPPGPVPQCVLSSLKTFNWSGRPQERDLAVYIFEEHWFLMPKKKSKKRYRSLKDCN
ncbi:FBD-associated F-box protein [Cardamine amara subsp. amara]|uniref:FBD-associated F-box protein n=1 Tax=Cardamine amara subsp. amara TaxID=228776 RepID=A0ABD1ABB5_CARAN